MKISFHIDDHADSEELAKLKTILALLEGEPTATVEDDTPVAPPKAKPAASKPAPAKAKPAPTPVEEPDETPADDDTPVDDLAEESAEETLDPAVLMKIKDAARKVMAGKGEAAVKAVLAKFKVNRITEFKPAQAQEAIKAFTKAAQ